MSELDALIECPPPCVATEDFVGHTPQPTPPVDDDDEDDDEDDDRGSGGGNIDPDDDDDVFDDDEDDDDETLWAGWRVRAAQSRQRRG
jgi:hypothetical protein